jgi:hypothetical protein
VAAATSAHAGKCCYTASLSAANARLAPADAEARKAAAEAHEREEAARAEEGTLAAAAAIRAAREAAARPAPAAPEFKRGKAHWDFVCEEMAWLAKEFARCAAPACHTP